MVKPLRASVLLVLCSFLLAPGLATAKDHAFVGSRKCKTCHAKEAIGNQYGSWRDSRHAKAFKGLASEKAKKWAAERDIADPQQDERCFKCHVTANGVPAELVPTSFNKAAEGVSCEACHGPGKDYRKKKVMVDAEAARAKGLIEQSEEVCVACHNDESPAWDPARYTRADGSKVGFDYDQAVEAIAHPVPEGYDALAEGEAD